MSEQTNGTPAGGAPAASTQQSESPQNVEEITSEKRPTPSTKEQPAKNDKKAADAPTGEKKLTGAELKAKAKAEKAARRAQQKNTKEVAKAEAAVSSSPQQLGPAASEVKGKQKGKDSAAASSGGRPVLTKAPASTIVTEQKVQVPECFSHLSMARRIPMTQADKDVHPVVLALGQQMATFAIDESITRLRATLLAFKKVCIETNCLHKISPNAL
jgi:translation initiation factor eIF-2B subunit delta